MERYQMLNRLADIFGDELTLSQAIEVVGRAVFTLEVLEEEGHTVDVEVLLEDLATNYLRELPYGTV
jgi:hypothetical protein